MNATVCPFCRQPMEVHRLTARSGQELERERQQVAFRQCRAEHELTGDLLAAGVEMVWKVLFR